ncbi:acyl-CoA N-acyltransferase [Saccharata proteae CBS 121410]|uniref:Acyl-CoA N-acyltransferase n=1 Tax=Saccharata proteae CBS 121410 TaxID=1314787 RepID=A0A6A5YDW9_9PEZI|nr:acyl-CoA N-acyltransferase [Saccharata proteae CBS 121410]
MAPFQILPATPADSLTIVTQCAEPAFHNDTLRLATFPPSLIDPANPHAERDWRVARQQKRINDGMIVHKAVDEESGLIAGFAVWKKPTEGADIEEEKQELHSACPPFAVKEIYDASIDGMENARKQAVGEDRNVWYLAGLATSPLFQRKGIGAQMLQWGIDQSERDGLPIYLEATPAGEPLYRKMGFETVAIIDCAYFLPKGVSYVVHVMLRKPRGEKGESSDFGI